MHASITIPATAVLADRLLLARAQTDALFDLIDPDALYDRPIPERHRLIFYLGHLEAFDWNQICRATLGLPSFHPAFDKLFEFGIDPEPGMAASDQPADWPRIEEVRRYNREVRLRLDEVLGDAPSQVLNIAIEHRLMHAETLAYLMHAMPYESKLHTSMAPASGGNVVNKPIDIPGGSVTLGQAPGAFGWDNEFAQHRVSVDPFSISKYKITNREYLRFMEEGAHTASLLGGGTVVNTIIAACLSRSRCRWTVPSTLPRMKRAPMLIGPGNHCPPKLNSIARRMARPPLRSAPIHGAMPSPTALKATSISLGGILLP